MALTAKQVAEELKKKLTKTQKQYQDEIASLLNTNGFDTVAKRGPVSNELKLLLTNANTAAGIAATGTCYYETGGVLQCETGHTAASCAAAHTGGVFVAGEMRCMLVVAEAMRAEGIDL